MLFYTMQYLIVRADRTLDKDAKSYVIDFVRVEHEEIVRKKKHKPKKPPQTKEPPPEPPTPELDKAKPTTEIIEVAAMDFNVDIKMSAEGFTLTPSDGDYLPIVKIAPIYPRRALSRGIEGYVLLEFTVSKVGTVKDIKVIESEPSSIFNNAAIKAAQKFKYKPYKQVAMAQVPAHLRHNRVVVVKKLV
jgi:protein TonB